MVETRNLAAYCSVCQEPTTHEIPLADPSACCCTVCGSQQPLTRPFAQLEGEATIA